MLGYMHIVLFGCSSCLVYAQVMLRFFASLLVVVFVVEFDQIQPGDKAPV